VETADSVMVVKLWCIKLCAFFSGTPCTCELRWTVVTLGYLGNS